MKYFDFHVHTFPDKIAEKAIGKLSEIAGIEPSANGTLSATRNLMRSCDIDGFCCLNIATRIGQEHTINSTASEINNISPGKIFAVGSVHPKNPLFREELNNIKSLGLKGIKLHPDYQEFLPEESFMKEFYRACAELKLFIVFHAGYDFYSPNKMHASPLALSKIAKANPDVNFVFAHMGGLRHWEEVYDNTCGIENVYFDTSMCHTDGLRHELAKKIINRHPPENVFFGSDCPWENPKESLRYIELLKISDDRKEKIFGANALNFLGGKM